MAHESEHVSSSQSLSGSMWTYLGVLHQPWPIKFTTLTKNRNNIERSQNLDSATTVARVKNEKYSFRMFNTVSYSAGLCSLVPIEHIYLPLITLSGACQSSIIRLESRLLYVWPRWHWHYCIFHLYFLKVWGGAFCIIPSSWVPLHCPHHYAVEISHELLYVLVARPRPHSFAALTREILFLHLEQKIHNL